MLLELRVQSSDFLLQFPCSKANEETESVKYSKGDIINNELLSNMKITLIKKREYEHLLHCYKSLQKMKLGGRESILQDGRREGQVPWVSTEVGCASPACQTPWTHSCLHQ